MNLVEYAWDSPTNRVDASGTQAFPPLPITTLPPESIPSSPGGWGTSNEQFGPIKVGPALVFFTVGKGSLFPFGAYNHGRWSNPQLRGTGWITSSGASVSTMVEVTGRFCCNTVTSTLESHATTVLAELASLCTGTFEVGFSWAMRVYKGSGGQATARIKIENTADGNLSTGSREHVITTGGPWTTSIKSGTGTASVRLTAPKEKVKIFSYLPTTATARDVADTDTAYAGARGKFTVTSVRGPF